MGFILIAFRNTRPTWVEVDRRWGTNGIATAGRSFRRRSGL